MNWLTKLSDYPGWPTEKGLSFYMPKTIGHYDDIYQSVDFPHVFLGSSNPHDMQRAEQLAGRPICFRVNVADLETKHLQPANLSYSLPEPEMWTEKEQREIKPVFKHVVDQLAHAIQTMDCPIYVHCYAGINRSVAALAGAISKLTGRPVSDVLGEIKSQRGSASPHDGYLFLLSDLSEYDSPGWKSNLQNELRSSANSSYHTKLASRIESPSFKRWFGDWQDCTQL